MDPLDRNRPYAKPGPWQTFLGPQEEAAFRQWVSASKVPFRPDVADQDYDMRGFWKSGRNGTQVNPNDGRMHYPDTYKTPLHESFSNQSAYANDVAPQWVDDVTLASPGGRILVDERKRSPFGPAD